MGTAPWPRASGSRTRRPARATRDGGAAHHDVAVRRGEPVQEQDRQPVPGLRRSRPPRRRSGPSPEVLPVGRADTVAARRQRRVRVRRRAPAAGRAGRPAPLPPRRARPAGTPSRRTGCGGRVGPQQVAGDRAPSVGGVVHRPGQRVRARVTVVKSARRTLIPTVRPRHPPPRTPVTQARGREVQQRRLLGRPGSSRSSAKVVSRLSETGSRCATTGASSSKRHRRHSHAHRRVVRARPRARARRPRRADGSSARRARASCSTVRGAHARQHARRAVARGLSPGAAAVEDDEARAASRGRWRAWRRACSGRSRPTATCPVSRRTRSTIRRMDAFGASRPSRSR